MKLAVTALWLCSCLAAQDFSQVTVEKLAGGYRFTEGPVWSPEGFLLFSDVPNSRIHRWNPGKPIEVFREDKNYGNGNALDAQGRLYTCQSVARRMVRTDKKGKEEVLADKWQGKRLNAPNDVVVRHDGHVWFTDPAFGAQMDRRELEFHGVFHITPKGVLELVAALETRPNGVTLGPKGQILYVADSDAKCVRAWDLDRQGKAANPRVLVSKIDGVPDGLRTDEKGNLYVAAGKGVAVFSPEGKPLAVIEVPEEPSNCAFGDPDYQTLYITAQTSVYRARLNVKGSIE
ncbi:MAG: SMP-30/gluconolactonase/LRE family protein [Acidobacteria bacterium]|nr:SMP-30/gluconolactonase/LRE family protein [Acidobacteriota bacterium]